MGKVVLPRKVAEALKGYEENRKIYGILFNIEFLKSACKEAPESPAAVIYRYYRHNNQNYFRALIEGYEVDEPSPEDTVKEFFYKLHSFQDDDIRLACQGTMVITLGLLGIKIKGVNTR